MICGKPNYPTYYCILTGRNRCEDPKCLKIATDYKEKKDAIMRAFAAEKELALRPLQAKLKMDLFLNDRMHFTPEVILLDGLGVE